MSNKRILIFGYSSSSHIRKWVTSLAERGYQIRLISLAGENIEGIDTICIPRKNKLSYFSTYKQVVKYTLDFKPDIIHAHYVGGYGFWGMMSKIHPFIVSVWGSDVNELPKNKFNKYLIKKILLKADYVTATSNYLLETTIGIQNQVSSKSKVIPFGVRIPEPKTSENTLNQNALFLKHLEKVYAPDILIKATKRVIQKIPGFKLTIAGDGTMKAELIQLIQKLGLNNVVTLAGYISHEHIYNLMRKHDFFVMPSLQEGFGVAAVEAFACSRPVVATNVGGIPEIVTDNVNGYLVEPNDIDALADAMIRMLSNKDTMIKMGQNGYKIAKEKYDWEKSVDQMVGIYESV